MQLKGLYVCVICFNYVVKLTQMPLINVPVQFSTQGKGREGWKVPACLVGGVYHMGQSLRHPACELAECSPPQPQMLG